MLVIDCPQALVGRIIGRGGETIKDLQARSGCKIQIDQNFPEVRAISRDDAERKESSPLLDETTWSARSRLPLLTYHHQERSGSDDVEHTRSRLPKGCVSLVDDDVEHKESPERSRPP